MKKKFLIVLLSIISAVCLAFGISACSDDVSVTAVSLNATSVSLEIGETYTLTATVTPSDADNQSVVWSSYNEAVVTVSDGTVIAVGEGTTVITATSQDSGKIAVCTVTVTESGSQNEGDNIAVTSVSLNAEALSLKTGDAATLIANILPSGATNKNVVWFSSDKSVATVSSGTIIAVSAGTAVITVKTQDGGYIAQCIITVTDETADEVLVASVSLNTATLSLEAGDEASLIATILPSNATNSNVTWCSSDPSVAAVNDGVVAGVSAGTAVITATSEDGGNMAVCVVTVTKQDVPVTSVSLSMTTVSLAVGDTYTLIATILPDDASNKNINWSSTDDSVATVSNGKVTAVAEGSAVIMATSDDGGKIAACTITVMRELVEIYVTSVSLDLPSLSIEIEDVYSLTAVIEPINATNQEVIWETSDEEVATVSNGVVTAISAGSAVITVTTVDGEFTAACNVTVTESAANLEYELSDDESFYYVSGYSGSASVVEIPNVHNGLRVSKILDNVFSGNKYVKQITLPNTIEEIGSCAFYDCVNLQTINLPESVSVIREYAFSGCTSLVTLATDNDLSNIETIGQFAFENCQSLKQVTLGDVTVGVYAFSGCEALTKVTFGDAGTISEYAFNGCTALKQVSFNSVNKVGYKAFSGCTALQQAYMGSARSIDESAFEDCSALINVTFITVSAIGASAFAGCSALAEINFPVGLTSIGDYAFENCTSLKTIVLPDSLTSVGVAAFRYAQSLESVTLSSAMTEISNVTFQYCVSLSSIEINENISKIGESAFSYCSGLKELKVMGELTDIGNSAFYLCTGLESIYYNSTNSFAVGDKNYIFYNAGVNGSGITLTISSTAYIPEGLFEPNYENNIPNITAIVIEKGAEDITYFSEYHNLPYLKSVTLPSTVISICEGFISGCVNVIETESGVGYIDKHAVGYTSAAQSVTLRSNTVVVIADAFKDCATLTSVVIPDSVLTIGSGAFCSCTALVNLTIGAGVTTIKDDAFKNCTALKTIKYNAVEADNLLTGNGVFYYAGHATSGITVTIGAKVKNVPAYLFYSDTDLDNAPIITAINFATNCICETIGSYAFAGCTRITSVIV